MRPALIAAAALGLALLAGGAGRVLLAPSVVPLAARGDKAGVDASRSASPRGSAPAAGRANARASGDSSAATGVAAPTAATRFAVGLRDETCACEDRHCLAAVNARWSRRLGQVHVSASEQASFEAALHETAECIRRLPDDDEND